MSIVDQDVMTTIRTVLGGLARADIGPLAKLAAGLPRVNRVVVTAVGLLGVTGLAYIDWHTGPHVGVGVVYALVVMGVTYHATWVDGAIVATFAAGAGLLDDLLHPAVEYGAPVVLWGLFSELGVFLIMVVIIHQVEEFVEELNAQSRIDGLTGLANTRAMVEAIDRERARSERTGEPLTVAFMDLDQMKQVNDSFGHGAGDEALRAFAATVLESIRTHDTFGRIGGDEFVLLLPGTDQQQAVVVVERLRDALGRAASSVIPHVTASIGVVTYHGALPSTAVILNTADRIMYQAKRAGGDRVIGRVVAAEPTEPAIVFDLAEQQAAALEQDPPGAASA